MSECSTQADANAGPRPLDLIIEDDSKLAMIFASVLPQPDYRTEFFEGRKC